MDYIIKTLIDIGMYKEDGEVLKSISVSNKCKDLLDLVQIKIQEPNQTIRQSIYHLESLNQKTKIFLRMVFSTTLFLELNETHRKCINYLISEKGKKKRLYLNK